MSGESAVGREPAGCFSGLASCKACAANQYSVAGGFCLPCPNGSYSLSGSAECTQCPLNKYARRPEVLTPFSKGSGCLLCPAGSGGGDGVTCEVCGINQRTDSARRCVDCTSGFSSAGSARCFPCEPNYEHRPGAGCAFCEAGKFSTASDPHCRPCPAGSSSIPGGGCRLIEQANSTSLVEVTHFAVRKIVRKYLRIVSEVWLRKPFASDRYPDQSENPGI